MSKNRKFKKTKIISQVPNTNNTLNKSTSNNDIPTPDPDTSDDERYNFTSYITDWAEEFSDAEDDWPGEPEVGWKEAERSTAGYSKTRAGTYKQSRYYYRQKEKEAVQNQEQVRKEHKTLNFYFKPTNPSTDTQPQVVEGSITSQSETKNDQPEPSIPQEPSALVSQDALAQDISDFDAWADERLKNAGKIWTTRIKLARSLLKLEQNKPEFSPISDSLTLAYSVEKGIKYARKLRRLVQHWKTDRLGIPEPKTSNHARRQTLFEDEEVITAVREYLNNNSWHSTLQGVVQTVEDVTGSRRSPEVMGLQEVNQASTTISTQTAARWLAKLGWVYDGDKKGYVDGHEREDVVAYRNNVFLPKMRTFEPELSEFDDNGPIPKPVESKFVLVTHDESTFSANDDANYHWKEKGTQPLKSKSRGKGLMVSDFLTPDDGRLRYQDSTTDKIERACQIIT